MFFYKLNFLKNCEPIYFTVFEIEKLIFDQYQKFSSQ